MSSWIAGPADWSEFRRDVVSYRWVFWFLVTGWIAGWIHERTIVKRATLGSVDVAMNAAAPREAKATAIVGITAADVIDAFDSARPVPPQNLIQVVTRLLDHEPAVLVVDVFTDFPTYRQMVLPESFERVVWAQGADTAFGGALPVLGGNPDPHIRSGLAAMLAEEDGIVRRMRPRFEAATGAGRDLVTLPVATVELCAFVQSELCRGKNKFGDDTTSVALRTYLRDPPILTLDDALAAAGPGSALAGKIVILGFVEGSDQVATPLGMRPGPAVVADAIETLLDERGVIRPLPTLVVWALNLIGALILAALYHRFRHSPRQQTLANLAAIALAWLGGLAMLTWVGYYSNFVPFLVGMWVENVTRDLQGPRKQESSEPEAEKKSGQDDAGSTTRSGSVGEPAANNETGLSGRTESQS